MPGIVSLLPSATEWVYALGLQHRLTAVTFECDEPAAARSDHRVVVTGLDTAGRSPGEVDALVRERVAAGAPLYQLDEQALADLAPDVVLTQDLCRVCALPADAADRALAAVGCPSSVVTLDPSTLAEVLDGAVAVGTAAGAAEQGQALRDRLHARLDAVAAAVHGRPRPRVLVLEWVDPPFVAGHWVPEVVSAAGGDPVLAAPGGRSTTTTWDDVAALDVDAVLVTPRCADVDAALALAAGVLHRLPPHAAVWAVDAGGLVTRPGPRVVDGVQAVAHALHPDVVAAPPAGRVARVPAAGRPTVGP
ncbi:cobalamin-binding protein [Angustibacter peucedani]